MNNYLTIHSLLALISSPDSSGNPAGLKANFSSLFGATNGSHEKVVEK
ncbi:hypothetical protein [Flavobacterium sp.]